jgi:hypothetical protein
MVDFIKNLLTTDSQDEHTIFHEECDKSWCPGFIDRRESYWTGMAKVRNSRAVSSMLRRKKI